MHSNTFYNQLESSMHLFDNDLELKDQSKTYMRRSPYQSAKNNPFFNQITLSYNKNADVVQEVTPVSKFGTGK